jgi:hypothetical protein
MDTIDQAFVLAGKLGLTENAKTAQHLKRETTEEHGSMVVPGAFHSEILDPEEALDRLRRAFGDVIDRALNFEGVPYVRIDLTGQMKKEGLDIRQRALVVVGLRKASENEEAEREDNAYLYVKSYSIHPTLNFNRVPVSGAIKVVQHGRKASAPSSEVSRLEESTEAAQ